MPWHCSSDAAAPPSVGLDARLVAASGWMDEALDRRRQRMPGFFRKVRDGWALSLSCVRGRGYDAALLLESQTTGRVFMFGLDALRAAVGAGLLRHRGRLAGVAACVGLLFLLVAPSADARNWIEHRPEGVTESRSYRR
jgi:hypothetical protein